ncbi:prepilin-type N-terminal cleavage/methylation domain-containing protein [Sulfurospirillum arcachonense]|uniref:prepilin-type N-terminal cleavage/methylation domain-containing protein n=1 Tax=Sulfurospirillum arcachonense TaxID=57666 RepID=UPI0004696A76|nr:prepilin-type N-terminal cleavage/methylation domain-containing protein [Sulfurospirillum arcachonense]
MKKAFTLVEIIVSVILLGLIVVFVSSTLIQTKNNLKIFEKIVKENSKSEKINDLLYKDIFQASSIEVKSYKKYSLLKLKTKHTIYNIAEPQVTWLVLKENNALTRLESAKNITLPTKEEDNKIIFIDTVSKECDGFSVNLSNDKKSVIVYIEIKNQAPVVFEVETL